LESRIVPNPSFSHDIWNISFPPIQKLKTTNFFTQKIIFHEQSILKDLDKKLHEAPKINLINLKDHPKLEFWGIFKEIHKVYQAIAFTIFIILLACGGHLIVKCVLCLKIPVNML
jgi:hypothetical protein